MTTVKRCLLVIVVIVAVSDVVYAKSRTSTTSQISDLSRKLSRLEQKFSTLQRDVDLLQKTNGKLTSDYKAAKAEIDRVSTRNDELQRMLGQFEKFFGKLYSESGAFDDPSASSVNKVINDINNFIGDKEASLIEVNPNYLYTVLGAKHEEPKTNVSEELMQKAVMQLANENQVMQQQVNTLEEQVVEVSKSKSTGISAEDLANTYDRIEQLEDIVGLLLTDNQRSPPEARSTARQKEFEDMVENVLFTGRAVSSTRKSVFSVSRSNDLLGSYYPQAITFDHKYVNKGNDFSMQNGTFYCQWTGYYFFTVTLRSKDDHYIGVSIMKTAHESRSSEQVASIYTDPSSRNTMETQSIALHLKTGDEVWLRMGPSDMYAIYSDQYRYITFTGFLIYKGN